jgi:uncharacterized protein
MRRHLAAARLLAALTLVLCLFFGCHGSADTHVDTPPTVATAQPSAAPSASAAASAQTQAPDALVAPAPAPVAVAWKPLLFKIAGAKPSYLFGTIHIPDPRLATFPPSLEKAIADSDEIVNEMPLDDATQAQMAAALKMPPGKHLSTSISPALLERLKRTFESKNLPGAAVALMDNFKVWAVAVQVALIDHVKELMTAGKPIDMNIHDKAVAGGKAASGLETEAEQVAVFDGLSGAEQARMLEQVLDEADKNQKEGKDPIATLMGLYIAGDEAPLLAELDKGFDLKRPLDQKLLKRLITDRNKIMTQRLDAKIKANPRRGYFVAVGAAHLLGDDGVIAQLKKKGYSIERVAQTPR